MKMKNELKSQYFPRLLLESLRKWIDRREIFAIKGPRQSGKTTLLKMLQNWLVKEKKVRPENIIFLTFEDKEVLEKFFLDPKEYVRSFIGDKTNERFYFLIDEFQYLENGGQILKLLYDIFENIKFVITGSSSLELTGKTAKFLVGRVFSFYLWQLNFEEFVQIKSPQLYNIYKERSKLVKDFLWKKHSPVGVLKKDIFSKDFEKLFEEYTIWGGFPEVVKAQDKETKEMILKNIYDTYISRDIVELLKIANYAKFKTLLSLLSSQVGNLINYNNLAQDSQSYYKEIKQYLSILEETYIIKLLRPFFANKATEVKKNPKVYFIDNGLRNYILGSFQSLKLRTDKGNVVENAIFAQLLFSQQDISIKYWRTLGKAEVDFILTKGNTTIPLEVKYTPFQFPKISRSLRSFISEYRPQKSVVLTKGFWGTLKINSTLIKFIPAWYL